MGVITRPDSPYYWIILERPDHRPLRESTKIPIDAATPQQRKTNRALADAAYHERMAALARARYHQPAPGDGITFGAFAAWYDTHHTARHKGHERERRALARFTARFRHVPLRALTETHAQEYRTQRIDGDGVKPATAERELNVLKAMLRTAKQIGHLEASPLVGMTRIAGPKIRKRMITRQEEPRLLRHLHGETRDLYLVGVDTLARLGNLWRLVGADAHPETITFPDSKTGSYEVPLSTRAATVLRARWPVDPLGPFFPDWHRRFTADDKQATVELNRELKAACTAAGIPYGRKHGGTTWHQATRATGATRMIQAGVDVRTVQTIGHWASLDQMAEYLGIDVDKLRPAVNRIAARPFTSRSRATRRRAKQPRKHRANHRSR